MVSAVVIFLPEHYARLRGHYMWSLLLFKVWQSIYFLLGRGVCFCACAHSIHCPTFQAKQGGSVACYLKTLMESLHTWRYVQLALQHHLII